MSRLPVVLAIAWKEFLESIRSKWLTGAIAVFAFLSLAIAGYGTARGGDPSLSFAVTSASLVSLVIYLIPIMGLLLGSTAICGEGEQGSLALLLSQPVKKSEIILGKYLGLATTLFLSILAGFGLTGFLLLLRAGKTGFSDYLVFLGTSMGLGLIFLSLALLISVMTKGKSGAAIGAVITWFATVFIFDFLILGVFILVAGKNGLTWLSGLLFLNPVDLFRLVNVMHLEELQASLNLAGMIPAGFSKPGMIVAAFLGWVLLPLGAAGRLFARREL